MVLDVQGTRVQCSGSGGPLVLMLQWLATILAP